MPKMKKKKKTDDEKVEDFVTETLKNKSTPIDIETLMEMDDNDTPNIDADYEDQFLNEAEEAAQISFDRIPPDSGMYVKVYKKEADTGKLIFLADIYKPENHSDISSELMRRAIKEGWGSGDYIVNLIKEHVSGIKDTKEIPILIPTGKNGSNIQAEATFDNSIDNMAKLSKVMADLNPNSKNNVPSTPPVNPNDTLEVVSKAMMTGINAGKEINKSVPKPEMNVVDIIKAMNELKEKPAVDTGELLKTVIALVANISQQNNKKSEVPPNDPLKMFAMMKEMGIIGNSQPTASAENDMDKFMKFMVLMKKMEPPSVPVEDPMEKSMKLITGMLPLMKEMNGDGSSTSVGVEVAKQLLPAIPQMVSDVASTIKTTVEAKRDIVTGQMKNSQGRRSIKNKVRKLFSKKTLVVPQLKPLADAVELADPTYFPEVTQLLGGQIGDEGLLKIIKGEITIQNIQDQIRPYSGGFFDSQPAINYFHSYIQYLRNQYEQNLKVQQQQQQQQSLEEGEEETAQRGTALTGTCILCGEQYGVESVEVFDKPETSTCKCGGRVKQDIPASEQENTDINTDVEDVINNTQTAEDVISEDFNEINEENDGIV